MMKLGIVGFPLILLLLAPVSAKSEAISKTPDFNEVYRLVKEHLADADAQALNATAVQSFLSALAPRVLLVSSNAMANGTGPLVSRTTLYEGPIGYFRVARVEEGLDQAVRHAWEETAATNNLKGLVLDLRFCDGQDYAAAAETAGLFVKREQPLLDWGQGMFRAKEKTDPINVPIAVLVNGKTARAAEALAAAVREAGAGLILGGRTAGQAMISRDYDLSDGQKLRIATAPVQLGDGSKLSSQGLSPDILVDVPANDEKLWMGDAFKELSKAPAGGGTNSAGLVSNTNRVRRPRFNEAELVRERKAGLLPDADPGSSDIEKPSVRDPVLARALDFLKGLSVVRQARH